MKITKKEKGFLLDLDTYEAFELVRSIDMSTTGLLFGRTLVERFNKEQGVYR